MTSRSQPLSRRTVLRASAAMGALALPGPPRAEAQEAPLHTRPVPTTGERLSTTTPVTVADLDASWDVAPPSLRAAATVATAAEVLAGAPEAVGRGTTLDAIVTELDDVAGEVGEPLSGELTELADLLRAAADLPAAPPGTTVPDGQ